MTDYDYECTCGEPIQNEDQSVEHGHKGHRVKRTPRKEASKVVKK